MALNVRQHTCFTDDTERLEKGDDTEGEGKRREGEGEFKAGKDFGDHLLDHSIFLA